MMGFDTFIEALFMIVKKLYDGKLDHSNFLTTIKKALE